MNKSGTASQVISHPNGGGAIQGLGDTFSPDLHTGTCNLSVPIVIPQGRGGLQPDLKLIYSSGQGNGPFGLGWALTVPGVTRDTSRGVPVYDDDNDVFLLSGAEQLVPVSSPGPDATRYRPRTEGVFARITRFESDADDYWEVRSRDGLISRYGEEGRAGQDDATLRDPQDGRRVFAWHLTETVDPFGNRIEYQWERIDAGEGTRQWDQLYLKTVRYANYGAANSPRFLITVDFTYAARPDPFSAYKSGFEIRTTQRCAGIEISTHADASRLTRVYDFHYIDETNPQAAPPNGTSLLHSIAVEGVDGDAREALPLLEFSYTEFDAARRTYRSASAVAGSLPERSLIPTSNLPICLAADCPMSYRSATRSGIGATWVTAGSMYRVRFGACPLACAWATRGCNWRISTATARSICCSPVRSMVTCR